VHPLAIANKPFTTDLASFVVIGKTALALPNHAVVPIITNARIPPTNVCATMGPILPTINTKATRCIILAMVQVVAQVQIQVQKIMESQVQKIMESLDLQFSSSWFVVS